MAYAALISLQQTTHLVLDPGKYFISVDERQLITSIRECVNFLISFFDFHPDKTNHLEGKITDLAHEAENLIEYFMWNQFWKSWERFAPSRVNVEHRLNRVREEIVFIIGDLIDDPPSAASTSRVATKPKMDVVVGLDDDVLEIKGRLLGESSKLEVIPIVGMGGIGKTTLAQKVYDDPLMMEYFDIRVWVTVSQDYNVDEILSCLGVIVPEELLEKNEASMAENVYKSLMGRRYLIVMDDIWSTNSWDDMRRLFPDDKNGSRIILTTRLSHVAAYASSSCPVHEMKFMDGNASWNLLKQKVFSEDEDCPHELEVIGKEISGGCGGLPLVVVLVAGVLSTVVKTRASWKKITKNVNSVVGGQLDEILSLSYRVLPHHLRPCFLFMAGFPEDHPIYVSRLIRLWVAEGFLKHQNEDKSLEEEAEEYLEDLVKRSLVLIKSRKCNGEIKSCILHDLVREMCIRKAEEEKFLVIDNYGRLPTTSKEERRISIGHAGLDLIRGPAIHTILCFQKIIDFTSLDLVKRFRLLRVLDLLHYQKVMCPPEVFELIHLRYLAVRLCDEIPAGISNLENLQTLIICFYRASYFLMEIWRLQHLRHLVFYGLDIFRYPEHGPTIVPLHHLQTLSGIPVDEFSQKVMEMIPNLKSLGIVYYSFEEHHKPLNFVPLHHLQKLRIRVVRFSWEGQYPVFPRGLKKLILDGGRLPWKDITIVGSLPHLQVLKLRNNACDGVTWETVDGEFCQLEYLLLEELNLEYWITESDHFPRLRHLVVEKCWNLREIPDCIGEIATLEMIEIRTQYVSELKSDKQIEEDKQEFEEIPFEVRIRQSLLKSVKQIEEDQREFGNDVLQVRFLESAPKVKHYSLPIAYWSEFRHHS